MWQARNHYIVASERAVKELSDTPPSSASMKNYGQSALFLMKMGVAPQNKGKVN